MSSGSAPSPALARYDRTQSGAGIAAALAFGAFVCVLGLLLLVTGQSVRSGGEQLALGSVLGVVFTVLVACGFVFRRLRVVVTDAEVVVEFGSGWPRRRIALERIVAARPVRNSWWYGWGIKLTPRGWMWNIGGFDAVEVDLVPTGRFRIGTDDPQGLLAAIEAARGRRHG